MTLSQFIGVSQREIDKFVLLDHMDWMSSHDPVALNEEWGLILRRASPESRIIFRTAASHPGYLERIRVEYRGLVCGLADVLHFETERSEALHQLDRVGTYGGFHIADLKKAS
jgi:S-adenosylmethionine-diacylglycerol 3-amino-3-carboxypropyl transferase